MTSLHRPRARSSAPLAATIAVAAALLLLACAGSGGGGGGGTPSSDTIAAASSTARGCPPAAAAAAGIGSGAASGASDGGAASHVGDPQTALREICAMMGRSAARWTAGELDAFMGDYMPGEGTTYIGRRGVVRGPDAIRAGYAPRFAPGGVHDSLSFEDVEVDLLAPDLANTIAFYVLSRRDSTIARGPTSLVMRRVGGRWRIVHDHSS